MPDLPAYQILEAYTLSKKLVVACYELTQDLPAEEKTNLSQYIKTAAITIYLNVAQGIPFKKKQRRKFRTTIYNALAVIDASVDALVETGLTNKDRPAAVTGLTLSLYQLLEKLKKEK